ncbi:MAG: hypothetical protein Q8M40_11740 [Legionella sp.]|nr:hypothetical protein [Legionella sp.]
MFYDIVVYLVRILHPLLKIYKPKLQQQQSLYALYMLQLINFKLIWVIMAGDTDVLIVGAGPIGLINAWGLKRLNPALNIVVLEKYEQYQRSHTLVMQAKQLEAIIKATGSKNDPILSELLAQLKKDPHIRTNKLQETFTQLAKQIGVEIRTKNEVKEEEINQTIKDEYPNLSLIIGADGTHSTVSKALYSENNQVKHEFDFVLQLRYEVNGEEKAPGVSVEQFYQLMGRKGLIANEYVGHFDPATGKTPITMQMMISKEDYLSLQNATSKNPIKLYEGKNRSDIIIPPKLLAFLREYITHKIVDSTSIGQQLDSSSVRISVNEAPATHAKNIVNVHHDARVILKGDAALGLSYFKGLNAGLEATAKFLTIMAAPVKDSFKNKPALDNKLDEYQSWFLKDFSPKKIREVGKYSFWQIRSFMNAMNVVKGALNASYPDEHYEGRSVIDDYFDHYTHDHLNENVNSRWRPFPHRKYDLVTFAQLGYVPLQHTAKKIAKIFVDYFKPYKSNTQLAQDFRQPLVGMASLFIGLGKTLFGIFKLKPRYLADGLFSMLRGVIELSTTPLTWLLKPMTRGISTLIHGGYKKIEENTGIRDLAKYGQTNCNSSNAYELLAVCNDIHRKFEKAIGRGENTVIGIEEHSQYANIRSDSKLDPQKVRDYFSLFTAKKEESEIQFEHDDNIVINKHIKSL